MCISMCVCRHAYIQYACACVSHQELKEFCPKKAYFSSGVSVLISYSADNFVGAFLKLQFVFIFLSAYVLVFISGYPQWSNEMDVEKKRSIYELLLCLQYSYSICGH